MKIVRLLVGAIPYGLVAAAIIVQERWSRVSDRLPLHGPRHPNESTGEIWEIAYRGDAVRYVTESDYQLFQASQLTIPVFMIAILWIMFAWWKAGVPFRSK